MCYRVDNRSDKDPNFAKVCAQEGKRKISDIIPNTYPKLYFVLKDNCIFYVSSRPVSETTLDEVGITSLSDRDTKLLNRIMASYYTYTACRKNVHTVWKMIKLFTIKVMMKSRAYVKA